MCKDNMYGINKIIGSLDKEKEYSTSLYPSIYTSDVLEDIGKIDMFEFSKQAQKRIEE